jgi:hypothetical protein
MAKEAGAATVKYGSIASDAAKATTAASLEYGAAMAKETGAATVKYSTAAADVATRAVTTIYEVGKAAIPIVEAFAVFVMPSVSGGPIQPWSEPADEQHIQLRSTGQVGMHPARQVNVLSQERTA